MNQPSSLKLAFYEALTPFCLFPVDLTTSPMVRGNSLCGATTITQAVFRDFSFLRLSVWIYLTALKIVFKSDLIHSASYCMVPRTLLMNKRNTHKKKTFPCPPLQKFTYLFASSTQGGEESAESADTLQLDDKQKNNKD